MFLVVWQRMLAKLQQIRSWNVWTFYKNRGLIKPLSPTTHLYIQPATSALLELPYDEHVQWEYIQERYIMNAHRWIIMIMRILLYRNSRYKDNSCGLAIDSDQGYFLLTLECPVALKDCAKFFFLLGTFLGYINIHTIS